MSRRSLCIATRNAHKLLEIRAVLADLDVEIRAAGDDPRCADVEEDAPTLAGNAEKKARWVAAWTGLTSLADDTGLEVDALDGRPGVYSARYAGPGCSFADNNRRLLQELSGLPPERRGARFRCVIAIAIPTFESPAIDFETRLQRCRVSLHDGCLEGRILETARGDNGFGYDPVFWIPEAGRTLAELSTLEKNRISHRGRAVASARAALVAHFGVEAG